MAITEQMNSHAHSSMTVTMCVCGWLVWRSVGKKLSL